MRVPAYVLPEALADIYGSLGFARSVLYSNFVSSIDGAVTLGSQPSAGSVISGRDPHDRFLMGLLRACAAAVLLGAGTLRATPGHRWTAEHIYPDLRDSFVELRQTLGLDPEPRLVLVTSSGQMDLAHPAIVAGATVLTTAAGARSLGHRLPPSCDVLEAGDRDRVDIARGIELLRERGYGAILTEGGPHLVGELLRHELLEELFLTVSPVLAGRGEEERLGMVAGMELLPERGLWSRLLSVRRSGDYLFLRYDLRSSARPSPDATST